MNRRLIWVLTCLVLCGCQTASERAAPVSDVDCPSPGPCDDTDPEARLPVGPALGPLVTPAAYHPLSPLCPPTTQFATWLRSITFPYVRRADEPGITHDPSDYDCDPPEAPLLRAWRPRSGGNLAAR
jgi:hypothetical protein